MQEFELRWRANVSRCIKLFNDNGFVLTFRSVTSFGDRSRIFRRNLDLYILVHTLLDIEIFNEKTQVLDTVSQSFRNANNRITNNRNSYVPRISKISRQGRLWMCLKLQCSNFVSVLYRYRSRAEISRGKKSINSSLKI